VSAAQVAGQLLSFPGGEHIAPVPTNEALLKQAQEWMHLAQEHHFAARICIVRGDLDGAVQHLTHERGKVDQALAIARELRGLPRGKRAREVAALQLVLYAVGDELGFLPGADMAASLETSAERVDNVQARLLNMADAIRSNSATSLDEASE